MAVKQYRALKKGYINGRVIDEGDVFSHEFLDLVRDESKAPVHAGVKNALGEWTVAPVYPIKRDKKGEAVTKVGAAPTWAEEISPKEADAQSAANGEFADPNLEAMDDAALQALAATLKVPFDKKSTRDDLIAAIGAHKDYRRG
jgi:hypothetical protein